jgi:hypothetical protein
VRINGDSVEFFIRQNFRFRESRDFIGVIFFLIFSLLLKESLIISLDDFFMIEIGIKSFKIF